MENFKLTFIQRNDMKNKNSGGLWELRSRLFTMDPSELDIKPGDNGCTQVWGVLMETGYEDGPVSLVVIGDGTVSIYFPSGGGVLGAGNQRPVWAAGKALLETAEYAQEFFNQPSDASFPGPGEIKFHILTFKGARMAGGLEKEISRGIGPLSTLYWAGQAVITQVRMAEQRYRQGLK